MRKSFWVLTLPAKAHSPSSGRILPRKFTDGTSNRQNNFQYSAGIIFRFSAQ